MPLFKILPAALWAERHRQGRVPWAPIDVEDGFVHLSDAGQVRETARLHFAGQPDLVLVRVAARKLPDLRWEPSRGGVPFPHVYGDIPLEAVLEVTTLCGPTPGAFVWPTDLPP